MFRFSPNPNRAHLIQWREWGSEAFREAEAHSKPLVLFLHAFWCGICHRMDETSFSDDDVIALLNAYFIPMRVEDAQRPDIDARYNQNGWPTIAFLTPQGEHLSSVNYLPPEDFGKVLVWVYRVWQEKKARFNGVTRGDVERNSKTASNTASLRKLEMPMVYEISGLLLGLVDVEHGGYGTGSKFPDVDVTEFLLRDFEATGHAPSLAAAVQTLNAMAKGRIHDERDGGFFRYSSKPDWNEPHREKLLRDQAGLLRNYLHAYLLTELPEYRQMAEGIIGYLNAKLFQPNLNAFSGCEDFLRLNLGTAPDRTADWNTAVDPYLYVDANAATASAYIEAWWILGRPDCEDVALKLLSLLWDRCVDPGQGMFHYFDGESRASGLVRDQALVGETLLDAFTATADTRYIAQATQLADGILTGYRNPSGGFYDIRDLGEANLRFRLTPMQENSAVAALMIRLAVLSDEKRFREAARWALEPFADAFHRYGVAAASYGLALQRFLAEPLLATLKGTAGDPRLISLARAALTRLGRFHVTLKFVESSAEPTLDLEKGSLRWGPISYPDGLTPEIVASISEKSAP